MFGKEYFLQLRCLKLEIGTVYLKYGYSAELKKHMYFSKENHLYSKVQHLAHCFPVKINIGPEMNTSCNFSVSR
jgi:hypothetical protein